MKKRAILLGICGGTASGKSRLTETLKKGLGDKAAVLCQDWYYRDHAGTSAQVCRELNFDDPAAIELPLLLSHIRDLKRGKPVETPLYDYRSHARSKRTRRVDPAPLLIIEGLFVLHERRVRRQLDLSVYIEVPDDERLLRRIRRDTGERRVPLAETLRLYERFVRPMHKKFVEPSAARAVWRWRQLSDPRFPGELLREALVRLDGR